MYGFKADILDGISVCSAAINGRIDTSQCKLEYPRVAALNGITLGGRAARLRSMLGRSIFCDDSNNDMDIKTGMIGGYNIVAGSKAAGRCIRRRNVSVEPFLQE